MLGLKSRALKTVVRMMLAIVAVTGVATVASPASPVYASCSGSSCSGLDPQANGCSTSTTRTETALWLSSFSVELRYSPACHAMWTRITIDDYLPTCCVPIHVRVWRQTGSDSAGWSDAQIYTKTVNAGLEGAFWTAMVPDVSSGDRTRSCWGFDNSYSGGCTSWA